MISLDTVRKIFFNNRKLLENFSYLSIIQVFNLIYPLLTYPYLIKVLGASIFGHVVFSQAIIWYFSIIINWGFEASATKNISIHRDNKLKLSEVVSSILIIKCLLWSICLFLLILLVYSIPYFAKDKLLYLLAFSLTFNDLLFPIWYFQGTEKMKYITFINIFVRCSFLILIFIFINQPSDYIFVSLLNGIGNFFGGVIALYIIFFRDKNKFILQPVHKLIFYLKDSFPLFVSNIVISIKDRFNVLLIGSFLGMHEVAIYDLATKIMYFFMQPIAVANNAIYPKVSRDKNMVFVKRFIILLFTFICMLVLIIQPFLQIILDVLSNRLEGTFLITEILLLSPVIMSVSLSLARNCLLVLDLYKDILRGAVYTTLLYLFLVMSAYLFNRFTSIYIFAIITVLTFFFELMYRVYLINKYKLFKIRICSD